MSSNVNEPKFALKHEDNNEPSPVVKQLLSMRPKSEKKDISCALAMQLAKSAKVEPIEVGRTLDILEYRINLCQLGLFGHKPVSKILIPEKPSSEIAQAIKNELSEDGSLSCAQIWELAKSLKLPKMTMAAYCGHLKIKIKPCQIGAF